MKCFICERNQFQVMLLTLPLDVAYQFKNLEILGNISDGERICLPCVGYQFDEVMKVNKAL